jgi:glutathione S-transferase
MDAGFGIPFCNFRRILTMLKLYNYPDCPFCQKVRVVLAEKDLEYEKTLVDLRKQDQKTPEFLQLNPYGKVPVLVDEDTVVYDSTIINEYLDEEYPIPALMPEDSQARAQVRTLEDYCDNSFIPPTTVLLAQALKPEGERDGQRVEQAREELRRCLYFLREKLDGNQYLVGNQFTLADAAFAPRMIVLGRLGFEFEPALAPVQQWVDRIRTRPSVASLGL